MAHEFVRGFASYASGMCNLVGEALLAFQAKHKAVPEYILMHPSSCAALRDDAYKRFGRSEGMSFGGVPIVLCGCQDAVLPNPCPIDWMVGRDGRKEQL